MYDLQASEGPYGMVSKYGKYGKYGKYTPANALDQVYLPWQRIW